MKKIIYLFSIVLLFTSCTTSAQNVTQMTAAQFKVEVDKNEGVLIDVRTAGEYNRGFIPGAKLISLQDPKVREKLLALPKDKPVLLYCYSGARSNSAANFLSSNGYTKIYNLQRGTIDWNGNKFPITTPAAAAANVAQPDQATIAQFQKLIASDSLVFVDFYAPWCAPCKVMKPYVTELQAEYKGKLTVAMINADASKELTQSLGINSMPYLAFYKNGKLIWTKTSLATKEELKKLFDEQLK